MVRSLRLDGNPVISIVSPYNGEADIERFAKFIEKQTLDKSLFELVISAEQHQDIRKRLTGLDPKLNLQVELVDIESRPGFHTAGALRNRGAAVSKGTILVFIDTDCLIQPNCLMQFFDAHSKRNGVAFFGDVCELPAYNSDLAGSNFETLLESSLPDHRKFLTTDGPQPTNEGWDYWYTCNASVEKSVFEASGGFDESGFRCHDQELAYRIWRSGVEFQRLPEAKAIHLEHYRLLSHRAEHIKAWHNMANKHPSLCGFAHDRIVSARSFIARTAMHSERKFNELVRALSGVLTDKIFVATPGTHLGEVREILRFIPHREILGSGVTRFQIRMHRACWDYQIFVPSDDCLKSPKVTIAIPVFEGSRTIERAISSVLGQTDQRFELLIIDDASSDGTFDVVKQFLRDPRLKYIKRSKNKGLSHSMNTALELSETDVILQLDSDDWLDVSAIENVLSTFSENVGCVAAFGGPMIHNERTGAKWVEEASDSATSEGYLTFRPQQHPRAYSCKALRSLNGWCTSDSAEGRFFEDRRTLSRLATIGRIVRIEEKCYNYTTSQHSLSRASPASAASAKLSILWEEANRRSKNLKYYFDGEFLTAEFCDRKPFPTDANSWSIVIPYGGNYELLQMSVRSWLESDVSSTEFEIIIVDDGTRHDLSQIISLAGDQISAIHLPEAKGAGVARNVGAKEANGTMILFSDADQIVPTDIIGSHEQRHRSIDDEVVVIGSVFGRRCFTDLDAKIGTHQKDRLLDLLRFSTQFSKLAGAFAMGKGYKLVDIEADLWIRLQEVTLTEAWRSKWGEIILQFGDELRGYPHRWTALVSASFSISSSLFDNCGGFHESLLSMEDWQFGMKLQDLEVGFVLAPEAEPLHQVHAIHENRQERDMRSLEVIEGLHQNYVDKVRCSHGSLRPPAADVINCLDQRNEVIQVVATNEICLTFDCGADPTGIAELVELLGRFNVHATFFFLGGQVAEAPADCELVALNNHGVGVQGWWPCELADLTMDEIQEQITSTIKVVQKTCERQIKIARKTDNGDSQLFDFAASACGLSPTGFDISAETQSAVSLWDIVRRLSIFPIIGKTVKFDLTRADSVLVIGAVEWLLEACVEHRVNLVDLERFFHKKERKRPICLL